MYRIHHSQDKISSFNFLTSALNVINEFNIFTPSGPYYKKKN